MKTEEAEKFVKRKGFWAYIRDEHFEVVNQMTVAKIMVNIGKRILSERQKHGKTKT